MSTAPAHQHFAAADATLAGLSARLIAGDSIADAPVLLGEVNRQLESARGEIAGLAAPEETKLLLRSICARLSKVQLLLDSAALLHCGSLYARPSSTGSYTADGGVDIPAPIRRFDFEV